VKREVVGGVGAVDERQSQRWLLHQQRIRIVGIEQIEVENRTLLAVQRERTLCDRLVSQSKHIVKEVHLVEQTNHTGIPAKSSVFTLERGGTLNERDVNPARARRYARTAPPGPQPTTTTAAVSVLAVIVRFYVRSKPNTPCRLLTLTGVALVPEVRNSRGMYRR